VELFAGAEKRLLGKSDIDYKKVDKDNIPENFTLKYLETKNDLLNKNVNTRSAILAPFNSSIKESCEESYLFDITYSNIIMKLMGKVKEANYQYELDYNSNYDDGNLIKNASKELKNVDDDQSGSLTPDGRGDLVSSNLLSPNNIESNKISSINTPRSESITQRNLKTQQISLISTTVIIDENILKQVVELGYSREYILKVINQKDLNHATSCYYIFNALNKAE
jgi:hypothetical protein